MISVSDLLCSMGSMPLPVPSLAQSVSSELNSVVTNTYSQAYGIFHLHGGHLKNWQYLFLIEGALTCLLALVAWLWLPNGPGSAWFLRPEEREFAVERMKQDNAEFVQHEYSEDGIEKNRLSKRDFVETLKDWKLWTVLVLNVCASVPSSAFSVFLPLVVQGLGYESILANLVCCNYI
jgi:hypothetical protein